MVWTADILTGKLAATGPSLAGPDHDGRIPAHPPRAQGVPQTAAACPDTSATALGPQRENRRMSPHLALRPHGPATAHGVCAGSYAKLPYGIAEPFLGHLADVPDKPQKPALRQRMGREAPHLDKAVSATWPDYSPSPARPATSPSRSHPG